MSDLGFDLLVLIGVRFGINGVRTPKTLCMDEMDSKKSAGASLVTQW